MIRKKEISWLCIIIPIQYNAEKERRDCHDRGSLLSVPRREYAWCLQNVILTMESCSMQKCIESLQTNNTSEIWNVSCIFAPHTKICNI